MGQFGPIVKRSSNCATQTVSNDAMSDLLLPAYRQLRPSERAFVDAYVKHVGALAAAIDCSAVDYVASGRPILFDDAGGMLSRGLVRAAIADRIRELSETLAVSAHKLLSEVAGIASSSMANYFEADGSGTVSPNFDSVTPEQWAAVASLDYEEDRYGCRKIKIRLHSKLDAIEKLMKFAGMYEKDNRQKIAEQAGRAITADRPTESIAEQYAITLRKI